MSDFKVSIIILQSLDGFIAKNLTDDLSWGSKADKQFFRQKTREIGAMILGRSTFENMPAVAFSGRTSVVVTSKVDQFKPKNPEQFFVKSPQKAIEKLKEKSFKSAALIGGGKLNRSFLENNLVNEIFITISGNIFLNGIFGFDQNYNFQNDFYFQQKFEIKDFKQLGQSELFVHFVNTNTSQIQI